LKLTNRFKAAVNTFRTTKNNSSGRRLARRFFNRGNERPLNGTGADLWLSDEDIYKGFPYAAFNKRANKVANLAQNHLKTAASKSIIEVSKNEDMVLQHPYLDIIDKSPMFSNYRFWYSIATYLDLEGTFYLFAKRNFNQSKIGEIQEFKLLNPYDISRIYSKDKLEVEGYVEFKYGMQRAFDPRQIIEMRMLNPFSEEDPYGTADALKDSQFTLNKSGDFTRHAISNNLNAPGIVTIGDKDLALDDEQMKIFKSRIKGDRNPGEPIFGVGDGSIKWDSMQIDLDKSALKTITDVNREEITAVTGASKTMLNIEQSGVTRESSKVQKDLFTEDSAMPLLQLIIDGLNQDYKVNYPDNYQKDEYRFYIDNPLGTDRDSELKDIQIRSDQLVLVQDLVDKGYDRDEAYKYAMGQVELNELTTPKEPEMPKEEPKEEPVVVEAHTHEEEPTTFIMNQFDQETQGQIQQNQATLENAVLNIEERLVATVINKVTKSFNAIDKFQKEDDILGKGDTNEFEKELALAIAAFYSLIIPLYGKNTLDRRAKEHQLFAAFNMNPAVKSYIKVSAGKASKSHIETIKRELFQAVRKKSLTGASQQELINFIRQEYVGKIAKYQATRIARTETNRAFTRSQYFADMQFIQQNDLDGKAYKKWITRSANPCPLCLAEAQKPAIPFNQAFFNLGEEAIVTYEENNKTKVLKQPINYETVEAGNLHVNCSCAYILIIE